MSKKQEQLSRTIPEQKYTLLDSYTIGDQRYELRLYGKEKRAIYNYSNKFKHWVPYAKASGVNNIDRHWETIKRFNDA